MSWWARRRGAADQPAASGEPAVSAEPEPERGGIVPLVSEHIDDQCYIYKHSTTCPVSASAGDVVRRYAWTAPVYWVNVIEQRPLSNWVAERYGVRHESPQLLKVSNGEVVADWSHFAITPGNIT